MSQPAISSAVGARPMSKRGSSAAAGLPCAPAVPVTAHRTNEASSALSDLDIPHLSIRLHAPRLDGVVVIDRPGTTHGTQLRHARLDLARLVDGAALQQRGTAVP